MDYDYITRTSFNQGILKTTGFVNSENLNPSGVWSLGLIGMDFFYRTKQWYAGQFIRKIIPKISIPRESISFFTVILNTLQNRLKSVLVRDVDTLFENSKIQLPTKNGEIDFKFMGDFVAELEAQRVAELEAQRVAELEAYLTVTGSKDYHLTIEEKQALRNVDKLVYGTFNLESLFGKATRGKRLKSDDRLKGDLPFVTAGENNEGISDLISNEVEIFSKNTITIDMFGSAKYRNYDYGADDHIAVVHTEKLEIDAAIFVTSSIHKSSYNGQFHYGRNFYAKDADRLNILLPMKDDKPDFEVMKRIISAVKKLVIKDVVDYADRKIQATEKVIGK